MAEVFWARRLKSYYDCLLLGLRLIHTVGLKLLLVGERLGWCGVAWGQRGHTEEEPRSGDDQSPGGLKSLR